MQLSRRRFLRGVGLSGAAVRVGLPPLAAMFNANGTGYAADNGRGEPIETRFLLWFNGNGIPERYWIPDTTGPDFELTPCLAPLQAIRDEVHVISGIDNVAAKLNFSGSDHFNAMCGLMTGTKWNGRGASGPSIDQIIARKIGTKSRFQSLQVGVAQESHGELTQRNMSWAGSDSPLPPEMIPHKLFDRVFGVKNQSWVNRKKSVLDLVMGDSADIRRGLGQEDRQRLDEHLTSVRDLERAISSLPPDYGKNVKEPEDITDLTDYPRIAKIQTDLVIHAFASGQTRVASYMLTKCQGLTRFPWLGLAGRRHHDYTHDNSGTPQQQRDMRDICRWHVEEYVYLLRRMKAIPEGGGTMLDHTSTVFVHEHAEAGPHKGTGLAVLLAGGGIKRGLHTKAHNSIGDVYLTIAEEVLKTPIGKAFPTAEEKMSSVI